MNKKTTKQQDQKLYEQAIALCDKINKLDPLALAHIVSYSPEITKVKVEFFTTMGQNALNIEYWGNAEFAWVKKNFLMNVKMVREAK
jgi:hypothetical protein